MNYMWNSYILLSISNYPYKSNFLALLPAWPSKEACNITLKYLHNDKIGGILAVRDVKDMV
jgi:hypothetical protein